MIKSNFKNEKAEKIGDCPCFILIICVILVIFLFKWLWKFQMLRSFEVALFEDADTYG